MPPTILIKILAHHGYSNQMMKPKFRQVGHMSQHRLIDQNGTVVVFVSHPIFFGALAEIHPPLSSTF